MSHFEKITCEEIARRNYTEGPRARTCAPSMIWPATSSSRPNALPPHRFASTPRI